MDPNATLRLIRSLTFAILECHEAPPCEICARDAKELAAAVGDLDKWIVIPLELYGGTVVWVAPDAVLMVQTQLDPTKCLLFLRGHGEPLRLAGSPESVVAAVDAERRGDDDDQGPGAD